MSAYTLLWNSFYVPMNKLIEKANLKGWKNGYNPLMFKLIHLQAKFFSESFNNKPIVINYINAADKAAKMPELDLLSIAGENLFAENDKSVSKPKVR